MSRKKLERKLGEQSSLKNELKELSSERKKTLSEFDKHVEARVVFQKATTLTQNHIAQVLSKIVSKALASVWEAPYDFYCKFVEKRNRTECELVLVRDGVEFDPLESCGYGVADIVSFAERIAYLMLTENRKVIVWDEPIKNLDVGKLPAAANMIRELSDELGIQFIINTHIPDIIMIADREFQINSGELINTVNHENKNKG